MSGEFRKPQFGLRLMLTITCLLCVTAAVLGGLFRGGEDLELFVILAMAAPLGMLLIVGVAYQVWRWWRRKI